MTLKISPKSAFDEIIIIIFLSSDYISSGGLLRRIHRQLVKVCRTGQPVQKAL